MAEEAKGGMSAAEILCALSPLGAPCLPPRLPPVRASGIATVFQARERHNNGRLGCVREARRLLRHSAMRDHLPVIATRSIPRCGTPILVENPGNGKRAWALRLDAGPMGCYRGAERRILGPGSCAEWGGRRAAIADLSPVIAAALELTGRGARRRGLVRLRWWR